jgi:HEPN domain-containing protein
MAGLFMREIEKQLRQKVIQWLVYAEENLRLAKHGLTLQSDCPCRLIAYHGQQCAEKYFKAYLVSKNVDFPYTHNIARLLELCQEQAGWPGGLDDAEELTPFAITMRYPGQDEDVSRSEAAGAVEIAEDVRKAILDVLANEGINLPDTK